MKNKITIDKISINKHKIEYKYTIAGEWINCFKQEEPLCIEYNIDISSVPVSLAIVPLLANILPVAWVCDAEIIAPVCDKAFFDSIEKFKKGYIDMYPMMRLAGKLSVEKLKENHQESINGSAAFFSGGVDAFNTLVCHAKEYPTLITIWGADIKFEDTKGWKNVQKHLLETCKQFNVDSVVIKSSFRRFLNEGELSKRVAKSGDGWWHGFQHGIGLICHAAPIAYVLRKKTIYIASSFTISDKGQVTCASDPTIDNFVKFGNTVISHDGYEFTRQMKINNIARFHNDTKTNIQLRVCWESEGGSNCCNCEKCWRTIIGLYAAKQNPQDYGFNYDDFQSLCLHIRKNKHLLYTSFKQRWGPIQKELKRNYTYKTIEPNLKWLYKINITKFGKESKISILLKKIKRKIANIFQS